MIRACLVAGALPLAGCASLSQLWPFGRDVQAPEPVAELAIDAPGQGAPMLLQYWMRNTLVVDLGNVPASGSATLRAGEGRPWPARIALRMAPQRFGAVEVRGMQRVVMPVAAGSAKPVTAELPPGIYDAGTPELTLSWGAAGSF
jgi:hypothetical protein